MVVLWLIIGCVVVSVAFFLPGRSPEVWPNINSAGIALLVYLVALLGVYSRSKHLTLRRRSTVLVIAALAILAGVFSWKQMEDQSKWQRQKLGEIGTIIGRGIYAAMITDSLLCVLDDYHHQKGKTKVSLGEIYRKRYPPGNVGDPWSSIRATGRPNPPDDIFLAAISDTQVVLVARHPWYRGEDTAFATYNGPKGTLQVRATLTEKGLQYVTEN
ncbi:MAG: hypothetical protein NTU47_14915 [Ignavibacteriales bacterium]|nr:hypothetical protein [Ignavibacteriales bacterium]